MKTSLSLKQRLTIIFTGLALAILLVAPLGMHLAARVARGPVEPRAVAVMWNSGPDEMIIFQ